MTIFTLLLLVINYIKYLLPRSLHKTRVYPINVRQRRLARFVTTLRKELRKARLVSYSSASKTRVKILINLQNRSGIIYCTKR